jgi:hypothetical protein
LNNNNPRIHRLPKSQTASNLNPKLSNNIKKRSLSIAKI